MRWLLALTLLLPLPATAQDVQSLADVKAELAQLAAQFLTLKQELVSSGAATNGSAGGDALQRLDAIEAALTKLTAKTEEVEFKVNTVVSDGTNRIGDIEFRLCELTKGCDLSTLPVTPDLGALAFGVAATPDLALVTTPVAPAATGGVELAMNEKADFDRAKTVLESGDFAGAADRFKIYAQSYPGGPLVPQADMYRGDALTQTGDIRDAGRAYLDAFMANQTGPLAGQALTKLGQTLGKLGDVPQACLFWAEVGKRFPGSPDEAVAKAAMVAQGCP